MLLSYLFFVLSLLMYAWHHKVKSVDGENKSDVKCERGAKLNVHF